VLVDAKKGELTFKKATEKKRPTPKEKAAA
jgi:hypothetical protein